VQEVLTPDDARTLLALCESGKLHDVEKWIASGKSFRVPPELKKTPLGVALETGFHSLIESLVRHEPDQSVKNHALTTAALMKRLDLVELLVS